MTRPSGVQKKRRHTVRAETPLPFVEQHDQRVANFVVGQTAHATVVADGNTAVPVVDRQFPAGARSVHARAVKDVPRLGHGITLPQWGRT